MVGAMETFAADLGGPTPAVSAQPAVAERAGRLLRQLGAALAVSLVGVGCSAMASHTLLRLSETSRLWPMLVNLASILVAVACLLQFHSWRQAQREWTGQRDVALIGLITPCQIAAGIAGVCALVGPVGSLEIFRQTAPTEQAHWWAVAAAVCTILGAGFGGIHPLDPAGPRGAREVHLVERAAHQEWPVSEPELDEDTLVLRRRRERAQQTGGPSAQ